jgi:hypothetical protein
MSPAVPPQSSDLYMPTWFSNLNLVHQIPEEVLVSRQPEFVRRINRELWKAQNIRSRSSKIEFCEARTGEKTHPRVTWSAGRNILAIRSTIQRIAISFIFLPLFIRRRNKLSNNSSSNLGCSVGSGESFVVAIATLSVSNRQCRARRCLFVQSRGCTKRSSFLISAWSDPCAHPSCSSRRSSALPCPLS